MTGDGQRYGSRMIQARHIYCALYFYHYISCSFRSSGIRSRRLGAPDGANQWMIKDYFLPILKPQLFFIPTVISLAISGHEFFLPKATFRMLLSLCTNTPFSCIYNHSHCCGKLREEGSVNGNLHTRVTESNLGQPKEEAHHQLGLKEGLGVGVCRDS